MNRQPVESSNIKSVGYSPLRRKLEVEFKGGGVYRYKSVPKTVYKSMMDSDSKGKFLHQHIKYQYPYRKYEQAGEKVKGEWQSLDKTASEIIAELIMMEK